MGIIKTVTGYWTPKMLTCVQQCSNAKFGFSCLAAWLARSMCSYCIIWSYRTTKFLPIGKGNKMVPQHIVSLGEWSWWEKFCYWFWAIANNTYRLMVIFLFRPHHPAGFETLLSSSVLVGWDWVIACKRDLTPKAACILWSKLQLLIINS